MVSNVVELDKYVAEQFDQDCFPDIQNGYIVLLTIKGHTITGLISHLERVVASQGGENIIKVAALKAKLRRFLQAYKKKRASNLTRDSERKSMHDFLHGRFEVPMDAPPVPVPAPQPVSTSPIHHPDSAQHPDCAQLPPPTCHTVSVSPPSCLHQSVVVSPPVHHPVPEPLPTSRKHNCRCDKLRESIASLNERLKRSRAEARSLKLVYSTKAVNLFKKRKDRQLRRKQLLISDLRKDNARLTRQLAKAERTYQSTGDLKRQLKRLQDSKSRSSQQMKKNVAAIKQMTAKTALLEASIADLEEEEEEQDLPTVLPVRKDDKQYGMDMRKAIYNCLAHQVPVDSVSNVIAYSVSTLTGQTLSDTPGPSTSSQMMREMGVLSDLQVCEGLLQADVVNIAWDATTCEGKHINEIHVNLPSQSLTVSTKELPGGRAEDYADHIEDTLSDIASVHAGFNGLNKGDVLGQLKGRIKSTLTDRAAANHKTVVLLEERLDLALLELNCQLHPLDGMANKARQVLKEEKHGGKCFGSDCEAANLLQAVSKLR